MISRAEIAWIGLKKSNRQLNRSGITIPVAARTSYPVRREMPARCRIRTSCGSFVPVNLLPHGFIAVAELHTDSLARRRSYSTAISLILLLVNFSSGISSTVGQGSVTLRRTLRRTNEKRLSANLHLLVTSPSSSFHPAVTSPSYNSKGYTVTTPPLSRTKPFSLQ